MNMRIHQLANVAQALSFLEKRLGADSIVDMGNEAIVNGDKKKTLALVFFIMIRYQIQVVLNDYGDDFAHDLLVSFKGTEWFQMYAIYMLTVIFLLIGLF
jgi:hypothetical protein